MVDTIISNQTSEVIVLVDSKVHDKNCLVSPKRDQEGLHEYLQQAELFEKDIDKELVCAPF